MCRKIREAFFILLGILSLLYYAVCISYAHIGVSWLWIWPVFSILCFLRFFMLRKHCRFPKVVSLVYYAVVLLFLVSFISIESRVIITMHAEPVPGLQYIITLGAAVRGNMPTSPLQLRIDTTVRYMNKNPETVLVASGGKGTGENMSEAECIAVHVKASGISAKRVLLEEESRDTEDNIRNSFALIPEGSSVGLVTNSFHMYRAMRIAELQGRTVYPVPAPTLLPLGLHYTVREFFAVVELELKTLCQ